MSYHPAFLGVVGFCRLRTVTIAASRVWSFSTLRRLSWMVHVLLVGTWPSRRCVIDSAMSNMAESLCLCRDPAFVPAPGAPPGQSPERPARGWSRPNGSTWAACCDGPRASSDEGDRTVYGSCDVHASGPGAPSLAVSRWHEGAGKGAVPECSRVADRPLRRRGRELCPAVSRQHRSRLRRLSTSCAGGNLLLPPRLQPLSLLIAVGAPLRPFFLEVHEELTRSWKAPFTARNKSCGSSALTTLDGGAALGYTGIPSVERSVAMQLCPTATTTLRGDPCLPSRACRYSSGLTGSAYRACGEAASALHAMALLQVHQAKALKDLHEGGHDLTVLHELHAATDLALRATKVTAQSLGRAMSMLVVQERHLWLCLADMKEQEKVQFLNAPVSQTGLFGDAVESFAQQFSAAQKQTEAIKHIMRRRKPAASTPAAAPPCSSPWAPLCGRPHPAQPQQPSTRHVVEPVADRTPSPSRPPPKLAVSAGAIGPETATRRWRRLLIGRWWLHHSLPRKRAGWRIFCFVLFLFRRWPSSQRYPKHQ